MGSKEIKALIATKVLEVRGFLNTKDVTKAKETNEELRALKESLIIAVELEDEEKRALEDQDKNNIDTKEDKKVKVDEMRSIVKKILGEEMTVEERAQVTTLENGAVLPLEFINKIVEIQKGYGSLKNLCDIIKVTKNEGTIPVIDLDQNAMLEVLEGDDILEGELVTTELAFKCVKVGLLQTLTSELLDDASVEIENLAQKNFANIATVKENAKILAVIKTNAAVFTPVESDYNDICTAIDKSLPSVKIGLVTITNVSGYAHLKGLKDLQERKLDLVTIVNGVEYFYGKPLVVVEDASLPAADLKNVYYVANTKEAIKYFDRQAITIATSVEAGFNNDTKKVRILERFDVAKGSVRSIQKIEF